MQRKQLLSAVLAALAALAALALRTDLQTGNKQQGLYLVFAGRVPAGGTSFEVSRELPTATLLSKETQVRKTCVVTETKHWAPRRM